MARKPRNLADGDVIHARTRFTSEEWRILSASARQFIIELIPRAKARSDVLVLAFAIMSNHIHLLLQMGRLPIERFYRSFHTALAIHLNRADGRLGPVVAGRPWIDIVRGDTAFECLRYVHSNQKEAGAAQDLRSSDWTSHPLFADLDRCPDWLDAHEAALLAGYPPTDAGVARLVADLERREAEPIVYAPAEPSLAQLRRLAGGPVDPATPIHDRAKLERPLVSRAPMILAPRLDLDVAETVAACAEAMGVPVSVARARTRRRAVVATRALAVFLWCAVGGRRAAVIAAYLGISEATASRLRRPGSDALQRSLPALEQAALILEIPLDWTRACVSVWL